MMNVRLFTKSPDLCATSPYTDIVQVPAIRSLIILALLVLAPFPADAKVSNINTGSVVIGYDTACGSGTLGAIRYNSGGGILEYCNGSIWSSVSGGSAGGGTIGATSGLIVELQNGSAAAPSLTFYSDTTTGLYFLSSHTLAFATNGQQRGFFDASGNFNVTAAGYQIAAVTVLSLPQNSDTTSIAIGAGPLGSQTGTSQYNTAIGYTAGGNITSGTSNTAVGDKAMLGTSVTGANNTAIGDSALYTVQGAAANNTALGVQSLYSNATASNNTGIGYQAMYSNTASPNTAVGYQSLYYNTTGTNNTALGYTAMKGISATPLTGNYNTGIGDSALFKIQGAAASDTAIGYQALYNNTTGSSNTAAGYQALFTNAASNYNTALGAQALYTNSTGADNTAIGWNALFTNASSSDNTAVGFEALQFATTGPNTALGVQAGLYITTGTNDTAIGSYAMQGITGTRLTGDYNTAVGDSALFKLQGTAAQNTAVGYFALGALTTGSNNVAVGYQAGDAGTVQTTGTNNTFIGYQAQANNAAYTNGTALGNAAILTASNSIVLGNSSISAIYAQVTSITAISDRRHKKDITPLPDSLGLDFIGKIRPVSYRFNNGDETERFGVIAQDLETALPKAMQDTVETAAPEHGLALLERQTDKDRTYRVSYGELLAPVVKSIQEQQKELDALRQDHAELLRAVTANAEALKALNAPRPDDRKRDQ